MMMSGGTVPYQEKTGWLGRGMNLAGLKGNGLSYVTTNAIAYKRCSIK
jgi:hypothetical protein